MEVKHLFGLNSIKPLFENLVSLNGSKTEVATGTFDYKFENLVSLNGSKTMYATDATSDTV